MPWKLSLEVNRIKEKAQGPSMEGKEPRSPWDHSLMPDVPRLEAAAISSHVVRDVVVVMIIVCFFE